MNDIYELIDIIKSLGGHATLDDICNAYSKKYKALITTIHVSIIDKELKDHTELVENINGCYYLKDLTKNNQASDPIDLQIGDSYATNPTRHKQVANELIRIFVPLSNITPYETKKGSHLYYRASDGNYSVESQGDRNECIVKKGNSKLFELYTYDKNDNRLKMNTRGMYLKHLDLNNDLIDKIHSTLQYNERYDMKHYFALDESDMYSVCESFKNIDENIDNHLVKPGEIENSSVR